MDLHRVRDLWDRLFWGDCLLRFAVFCPLIKGRPGRNRHKKNPCCGCAGVYLPTCVIVFSRRKKPDSGPRATPEGDFKTSLEGRIVVAILFLIALPTIAKRQAHAESHDSEGRSHQDCYASANRFLTVFGGCRSGAVAHGATLREGRRRPQAQKPNQRGQAARNGMGLRARHRMWFRRSHLTPNEIMRNASGKKTIIMARQNTSEVMVSHFICDTSYFMCMK